MAQHRNLLGCSTLVVSISVLFGVAAALTYADNENIFRFRRVAASDHGLGLVSVDDVIRIAFGEEGGSDWNIIPKGGLWLFVSVPSLPGEQPSYLGYRTRTSKDVAVPDLILSSKPDENCLWDIQFEGDFPKPADRSLIYATAKATVGELKGRYLGLGQHWFDLKRAGLVTKFRRPILQMEKNDNSRLKIWQDGK